MDRRGLGERPVQWRAPGKPQSVAGENGSCEHDEALVQVLEPPYGAIAPIDSPATTPSPAGRSGQRDYARSCWLWSDASTDTSTRYQSAADTSQRPRSATTTIQAGHRPTI